MNRLYKGNYDSGATFFDMLGAVLIKPVTLDAPTFSIFPTLLFSTRTEQPTIILTADLIDD
jgi:hypothetical protein